MKKLINGIDNIVDEMLDGLACAYPQYLRRLEGFDVVVRANGSKGKVALVSGGGSGHEPAHGGYVGKGLLDGAIAGAVFTSPTPDQVYEAIRAADGGRGVLLVIKNYTGDVMNFEMAADMARDDGIEVEQVITADDVAVENSTWTTGRRYSSTSSPEPAPRRAATFRRSGAWPKRSLRTCAPWAWRSTPAPCPRRASPPSTWPRMRSR